LDTALPGVWELRPNVIRDARGFFQETYHQQKFSDLGIHDVFVQDNHSRSAKELNAHFMVVAIEGECAR